jgi:peptidoglycan/LPS O-acetylase OafA/YrhL
MENAHHSFSYRPDIDGLRAIAVLGVVLFHAGLGIPGGYVGVDIFFVISGFLITSILLKDLRRGTFSFFGFWERRARRILPALTVVVLAIVIAGWFLMLPADYEALGRQIIALVALSSNIQFWRETGYFAAASEEKPMLHTWSLSLEEQFYLFLPILLFLLFRFRKSAWIAPTLIAGSVISFALSIYGSYRNPASTFFLLPTRAWELATGSLLAFANPLSRCRLRSAMAWTGLAAILLPFFFYHPGMRFPGLSAVPPVAGATLLIWCGMRKHPEEPLPLPGKFLTTRPLVWIGLISYSLYLWHWPLFAYEHYLGTSPASLTLRLSLIVAAFILAALSLRFIERPFRSREHLATKRSVAFASTASMAATVILAFFLVQTNGYPPRVPADSISYAVSSNDFPYDRRHTVSDIPDNLTKLGIQDIPEIFVWGDSHAMAMLPAIHETCLELGKSAAAATRHGLSPTIGWARKNSRATRRQDMEYSQKVFEHIVNQADQGKIKTVILIARWSIFSEIASEAENFEDSLENTIRMLLSHQLGIIIVKETPCFPYDVPRKLAIQALFKKKEGLYITREDHLKSNPHQSELFERISRISSRIVVIDPVHSQIDAEGRIPASEAGRSLYKDEDHLSSFGSLKLKDVLRNAITLL